MNPKERQKGALMNQRFQHKVAIVTAGGAGIGAATATGLAREGAAVMVADISGRRAEAVAQAISQAGGQAQWHKMDAAVPEAVEAMIAATLEAYGQLDVLINNAGYAEPQWLHEVSMESWQRTLAITLTSVFIGLKYAIPIMRHQGHGVIVNTASISGLRADYGMGAYNAAKAGVINLTRTAALENARYGIRVNCVCPGGINTRAPELLAGAQADAFRHAMAEAHPIGRMGTAAEVAEAILFLASDAAAFITGVSLPVDGGITSHTGLPDMMTFRSAPQS
jgi:meso-butanediol dehydrogenase/(S,S)-butanediol dehydrogenase/diacetyl reductase